MVSNHSRPRSSERGFTLVELLFSLGVFLILIGGITAAFVGIQRTFMENQVVSAMQFRAEHALDRLIAVAGQAVTTDPEYTPLKPSTGIDSNAMRFRMVETLGADPTYDDLTKVYIYGADNGGWKSEGLIIGRGPTMGDVYTTVKGPDGILGTEDDDTSTSLGNGVPAGELLIPSRYAPRTGKMFSIDLSPDGRLVTLTLRVNARGPNGSYVLANDLVLTERVALLQ